MAVSKRNCLQLRVQQTKTIENYDVLLLIDHCIEYSYLEDVLYLG